MRLFCLTVHFYSPKAYDYIRSTFSLNLPSIRTIRLWYSSIDSSPGFTEGAFDVLQQKANEFKTEGKSLTVGLIFDEMAIRKHSQFDLSNKEYLGHINAGRPECYDVCSPLAKEALVFMVSGIGSDFKIPIGYFLSNGLCSQEKSSLLDEAILKLTKIGVGVASITSDGASTNIPAYKELGADFENDKPYFQNKFKKGSKIYIVLDAPHMLKLARNVLSNKQVLYDGQDRKIEWRILKDLVSFQISNTH